MPTDEKLVLERIVFDGSIGITAAALLAVAMALVAAWLMWRERRTLGLFWAALFWMLRVTALAIALWMLVGPMQEQKERRTKPQSIAILADGSNSMITVDPAEPTDTLRWSLSTDSANSDSPVSLSDRAAVALHSGHASCLAAERQITEHRPLEQLRLLVEDIATAVSRATDYCDRLAASLDDYEGLGQRASRADDLLAGPVAESLDKLQQLLEDRHTTSAGELTIHLENLTAGISAAERRLHNLSRDIAGTIAAEQTAVSLAEADLSRREKTATALDSLEESLLAKMDEEVRIRRFLFDDKLAPVGESIPWKTALESVSWESDAAAELSSAPSDSGSMPSTDITKVLEQLASETSSTNTRLALVLSDGHHNALKSQAPQEAAANLINLPVYIVPVGSTEMVRDVRLHRVEAPSSVIKGDTATIETIVTATNCDGLSTEIVLRHDGIEQERKLLAFHGPRIDRRVQFEIACDELGLQDYEIDVELVDEEANSANNVVPISIEVVRDRIRVLLVDGISQWEYRYLQQLFRRDRHIEFDELLFYPRVRGSGDIARRLRLPETADAWSVYDVVIMGDVGPKHFSNKSQEALVEYVRRQSGHLILIAGRDHMPHEYVDRPLMDVLPVDRLEDAQLAEPHGIAFTDEGRLHSAMAIDTDAQTSQLAWENTYLRQPLYELSIYSKPKETTRTLLHAVPIDEFDNKNFRESLAGRPSFLCWQQVGAGRVVYLSSPQTYLLRFRRGDRRHHRFWGQMLRWITAAESAAGSDTIRLSTNRNRYQVNEPIEVTVWLKDQSGRPLSDQSIEAVAKTLDGPVDSVEMQGDEEVAGRYFAKLADLMPGTYEIALEGDVINSLSSAGDIPGQIRTLVTVEGNDNIEMLDTSANLTLLEQVAKITGGQVLPPTAMSEVIELASLTPEVTETVRRKPLWNRWANLWIVFGCLAVEWIVRKQKGLV